MKLIILFFGLLFSLWAQDPYSSQKLKIALLVAPSVVGQYSQSTYNVALSTLMASKVPFELVSYEMKDESVISIDQALEKISNDSMQAVLAPLTLNGVKNLLTLNPDKPIFIPTVHKRDVGVCNNNIIFGAIDYQAQIEALVPYMGHSLAIFYGDSAVGNNLAKMTQTIASEARKGSIPSTLYSVDNQGANIVKYLARPAAFSKKSIVIHLPVVKASMLASHLTFTGAHEHNILSTQINFDPTLITLTQYNDRRNMIVANSIVEQVPSIYEINSLMNNDLTFDWINYTTSVGIDYLISYLNSTERLYSMRLIDSQVIYPVELMKPKEFGFEPMMSK
ncbi:MAG: hypothetical protein Q7T77_05585 [Sulfuricurvum sp.]|nr:hypothetical protein [Sulfuricurvum sp.]